MERETIPLDHVSLLKHPIRLLHSSARHSIPGSYRHFPFRRNEQGVAP